MTSAAAMDAPEIDPSWSMNGAPTSHNSGAPEPDQAARDADAARFKSNWRVYGPDDLKQECARAGQRYVIDPFIKERALGIMIGASGIGKTPLAYQMAICVAAGILFLGFATQKTRVLFLDFENGLQDVNSLIARLSTYLGLSAPPDGLFLWNVNDSALNFGQHGHTIFDLIRDVKPGLVFADPLSALYPAIEKSNTEATEVYQHLRKIIRDCGCAIVNLHHPKKPLSPKPGDVQVLQSFEDDHYARWFHQARGAGVLVNGADVRLAVDIPGTSGAANAEICLVMGGYERIGGELPLLHLERVFDQDEPVGYRKVRGIPLLCNPEQEAAFSRLPDRFGFKDAMRVYGRKDGATSEFLGKCIARGIARKIAHGVYEKVVVAE